MENLQKSLICSNKEIESLKKQIISKKREIEQVKQKSLPSSKRNKIMQGWFYSSLITCIPLALLSLLFFPLISLPIANVLFSGIAHKVFKFSHNKKYVSQLKRLTYECNELESSLLFEGRKNKLIQQKIKELEEAQQPQDNQLAPTLPPIEIEDEQAIEI